MKCPSCGAANDDGARFCGACGNPLSLQPRTCGACGKENSEKAAFCINCGLALRPAGTPEERTSDGLKERTGAKPTIAWRPKVIAFCIWIVAAILFWLAYQNRVPSDEVMSCIQTGGSGQQCSNYTNLEFVFGVLGIILAGFGVRYWTKK
jgi:uncharacterized membrane protein YvbJ